MKKRTTIKLLIVCSRKSSFDEIRKCLPYAPVDFEESYARTYRSFVSALQKKKPEVILLLDHDNPVKPIAIRACLKKSGYTFPVLLITDEKREDKAIRLVPGILDDYVLASQIKRIPVAIQMAWQKKKYADALEKSLDQLKESEKKWNYFTENLPTGIYQTGVSGEFQYVNQYLCRVAGIKSNQAKAKGWLPAIHPDDKERVSSAWHQCYSAKTGFHDEFRFLTPANEVNWVSVNSIAVRDESGKLTGFLGAVNVINDTKQLELELAESQGRLEAVQELARDGDWELDLKTQTCSWSAAMYPIFRRDPVLGPPSFETFLNYFLQEDQSGILMFRQKAIDNGHAVGEDLRIQLEGEHFRYVYPTAYCMYDSEGTPEKLICTLVDVTERHKTHESLKQNEQLVDALFSQSNDGMFQMKLDQPVKWKGEKNKEKLLDYILNHMRMIRVNEEYLDMHKGTASQITGSTPMEYARMKGVPVQKSLWAEILEKGRANNEIRTKKFDGSTIWIRGDYICLYDKEGRVTGQLGFQKDITREKAVMEDLKYSERNFREIFENSPDGIYIEDYNGKILDLNPEACRIQQLPKEKLKGKNIIDITPDPQKAMILKNFKKFCDGTIDRLESFSWDKDWNAIPVEIKGSRIVYGGIPAILLHVRDMRIKKITEGQFPLQITETMKNSDSCVWEWNVLTGEYKASGIEEWLLGYKRNEVKPTFSSWTGIIHPDDLAMVKKRITDHIEGKSEMAESTFRLKSKNGKYIRVMCRGKISERDRDNIPVKLSGIKLVVHEPIHTGSEMA